MRLAIASLLFLSPLTLLPYAGAAQPEAWTLLGLDGETVLALSVGAGDGERLIYAETQTGLWRYSPAAGWGRADQGLPRGPLGNPALAAWRVVPGRAQQIYAATGIGTARQLYRSDDAGHAWVNIGPAPGQIARPPMLVLAGAGSQPAKPGAEPAGASDFITLVTDTRVQRSTDGGATWAPGGPWPATATAAANEFPTADGETVRVLLGDVSAPERLYALTASGAFWTSESGGRAWRAAYLVPGAAAIAQTNGGSASTAVSGSIPSPRELPSGRMTALAIAPYFGMRIWVAGEDRLFYSPDNGATWIAHPLPDPGQPGRHVKALLCDPRVPETLYAALADGTVYRTDDTGATWVSLGKPGGTRITALALDPETRAQLYVATGNGVWVRNVLPLQPTAIPVPTATPTLEPGLAENFASLSPTSSPQPTVTTPTITASATATASLTPSVTPTPTATATVTPSQTPTRPPTVTPAPPTATAPPPPTPLPTRPPGQPPPASPELPAPTPAPPGTPPPR